jgi:hypothetical protein
MPKARLAAAGRAEVLDGGKLDFPEGAGRAILGRALRGLGRRDSSDFTD